MSKKSKYDVEYGFADQREKFSEKYIDFIQCMPNIKSAIDTVLKAARTKNRAQQVIWGLARLAFEDEFQAMILACANGYSHFAKQPLRALFEKVVTLLYLKNNPKDVQLYLKYRHILRYRQLQRLPGSTRDAKTRRNIRRNYKNNKSKFPNKSRWHKKTIPEMAKEVGIPDSFIELAYYNALQEAHPSLIAILHRYDWKPDGSLWWKDDLPPVEESEDTLKIAHFFVLKALEEIKNYFKVKSADEILSECAKDYLRAWNIPNPSGTTTLISC